MILGNKETRIILRNQVKLHIIIIKVHTNIFQPTPKFRPCHFLWPAPIFVDPRDPCDQWHSSNHAPTLPTLLTLCSRFAKLMWTTKKMVQLQWNSTYFLWKYPRFWELILDGDFQSYLKRQKAFPKLAI